MYIHTIWFDKIHFVTRTKMRAFRVTNLQAYGPKRKTLQNVCVFCFCFFPTIAEG